MEASSSRDRVIGMGGFLERMGDFSGLRWATFSGEDESLPRWELFSRAFRGLNFWENLGKNDSWRKSWGEGKLS